MGWEAIPRSGSGGGRLAYCTRCGADNPANARFCMNCAAPLDVGVGPMPAQMPTPGPPPYAYPPRPRQDDCFGQRSGQDQCFGQSRVPGLVVLAIIIILIGVFSLLQWILQQAYGSSVASVTFSGLFLVTLGIVIIVLWLVLRRPRPRV
jgi:hypothetical protein